MWKISVVMLVTAAFAGLLIYNPYEPSAKSATFPISEPPRPANLMPALARAETAHEAEAQPTQIRPQDLEDIVLKLKVLTDRIAPLEKESPGTGGILPDKPGATVAQRPLPASNESREQPVLQTAAQTPVFQPVSARREDPPVSHMDVTLPDKPVTAVAQRPLPASNRLPPLLQSSVQTPVVQPVSARRDDLPAARVDVEFTVGGTCASGEVIGLDPNGDNFLSVRSGPGGQPYREIDRLFTADAVHVCGRKDAWLAVVYTGVRKAQESCDIGSKGTRRPYEGPCQYGWVHSRYVKVKTADNSGRR